MSKTYGYLSSRGKEGQYQPVQRKTTVNNSPFVNYSSLSINRNTTGCAAWFSEGTTHFSVEVQLHAW